ncbi:MAG: hypothetical protein GY757_58045 [bacterium]|nr:hypothetical protein [bacterium]
MKNNAAVGDGAEPWSYHILFAGPVKFKLGERVKSLEVSSPEFLVKKDL